MDPFDLRVPIEDLVLKEQKHSFASEESVQERDQRDTQTGYNMHTERGLLSPVSRKQSGKQLQAVDHQIEENDSFQEDNDDEVDFEVLETSHADIAGIERTLHIAEQRSNAVRNIISAPITEFILTDVDTIE